MDKWIHFIGIAGVTTAGLAKAFKDLGFLVTGSDKGFYPPVKDFLEKNSIEISLGYKPERLELNGMHPGIVVVQGTKGDKNPEYIRARELNLNIKTYPEILKDYCVLYDSSIVVAGSYGKSTITAILVNIFKANNTPISYMFGGFDMYLNDNVKFKDHFTKYSVIEGDEYLTSFENTQSKFFYYSPKYLIINGIEWDHQDLFPTFESYLNNFKKFVDSVPENGLIIANYDNENVREILSNAKAKVVFCSSKFSFEKDINWKVITDSNPKKVLFRQGDQLKDNLMIPFKENIVGEFNNINILLASAMAFELGVTQDSIQTGIESYMGLKRRLEVKYVQNDNYIIDDFGSTVGKAKFALEAVQRDFPEHHIHLIFDPSSGARSRVSLNEYNKVFESVHPTIELLKFSLLPNKDNQKFSEDEFASKIESFGIKVNRYETDSQALESLKKIFKEEKKVILFLGSHSFRGMISNLIKLLEDEKRN